MSWHSITLWEQPYIDLWTTVHFSAGTVLGVAPLFVQLSLAVAIVSVFALAVGWEVFEVSYGIQEHFSNQVVDVLVAIVGLIFMSVFILSSIRSHKRKRTIFAIALSIFLLLNFIGWIAYQNYSGVGL